ILGCVCVGHLWEIVSCLAYVSLRRLSVYREFVLLFFRDYQQKIHPKNQEHVCAVREQLQSEQETPAEPGLSGSCIIVQDGQAEPILILQDLSNYNRWFSGQPRSLMDRPAGHPGHLDIPSKMAEMFSMGNLFWTYPVSGGALIYLASPLDFIPKATCRPNFFVILLLFIYVSDWQVTQTDRLTNSHWTGVCN
uniref:Uncharacterized protein n=1 Tax=Salmo trutta TaxID=8032 RepID=A0A674F1I5_SALTR